MCIRDRVSTQSTGTFHPVHMAAYKILIVLAAILALSQAVPTPDQVSEGEALAVPTNPGQIPEEDAITERRGGHRRRRKSGLRSQVRALRVSNRALRATIDTLQVAFDSMHAQFDTLNAAVISGLLRGPAGNDGAPGNDGPQGPQGNDGAAGVQGATGPQGPSGNAGAPGPQGARGATGPSGNDGATGAQGPQGNGGTTGAQGATGAQGPQGTTGAQGNPGAGGPPGSDGATGPQGNVGATGAPGPSPTDQFVRVDLMTGEYLNIVELQAFDAQGALIAPVSAALSSTHSSSEDNGVALHCIDGSFVQTSYCHTKNNAHEWLRVRYLGSSPIAKIVLTNRINNGARILGASLSITSDAAGNNVVWTSQPFTSVQNEYTINIP
eukprot:TRINITY_DN3533_c0_g1_i1.p1 TRINITY_DN3533_c0_g1~~TRINITY_DN3533_c0_g1_i1.p1  ORF type:complete len:382 (-),score=47.34 TRINITY_DN3533_c0_g1_i1:219-1364(-)